MKPVPAFLLLATMLSPITLVPSFAQSPQSVLNSSTHLLHYEDSRDLPVPPGRDLREVKIQADGKNVLVRLSTFGDWDVPFTNMLFTGGGRGPVSIGCFGNLFRVVVGSHPHCAIEQRGIPQVQTTDYIFGFSWQAAFGDVSSVTVRLWTPDDRAPDTQIALGHAEPLLTLAR